jgi:hypothetical protein
MKSQTDKQATYDDVNLILRLFELRREEKMRQARDWVAKNFHAKNLEELETLCPMGSEPNAYFRMVISYWEMVAGFITSGVLNQESFFQSGREMLFVWERFRDVVPAMREAYKDSMAYKNLETVAEAFAEWLNRRSPGAYEAFSTRVRGM